MGEKGTPVLCWRGTHLNPLAMSYSYPFFTSSEVSHCFCLLHALDHFHIPFHISITCPNWEFLSPFSVLFLLSLCNWWRRQIQQSKICLFTLAISTQKRSGIQKKWNLTRNSCMHFIYIHSNRDHSRLFHLVSHPDGGCHGCFDGSFAIKRFCRNWCFWQYIVSLRWISHLATCYSCILHIHTYIGTNQTAQGACVIQDVPSAQLMKTLHRQIITKSEYGQSSSM